MKKMSLIFAFFILSIVTIYAADEQMRQLSEPQLKALGGVINWSVLAAAIVLGISAACCGIGQGIAVGKAMEGIARQPEATKNIQANMILGLAFIESLTIYALLIALILLFVNPFIKYFM